MGYDSRIEIAGERAVPIARTVRAIFAIAAAALAAAASAQAPFPAKPVRILVGFSAGGSTDVLARLVADELRKEWSQPVVVENRVGAGGALASEHVAKSVPDGHTLYVQSASHTALAALKQATLPFDSVKDFTWITLFASAPNVLVVRADSSLKQLPSYVAAAKAKPGEVTYASSAIGGALHLAGETFAHLAGIKLNHIPYKGANEVVAAVLSGTVQSSWSAANAAFPLISAGKLHAVAVASEKRFSLMPDTPTFAELGIKGMKSDTWVGLMGPAGMPRALAAQIDAQVLKIVARPEVREKILKLGAEPMSLSLDPFAAMARGEVELLTDIARKAGIKAE